MPFRIIKGKTLLFVNGIDRCYRYEPSFNFDISFLMLRNRLKLYLEQFSIKSCVLNSELPVNTRFEINLLSIYDTIIHVFQIHFRNHIVTQFSLGVYEIIIATDESQRW